MEYKEVRELTRSPIANTLWRSSICSSLFRYISSPFLIIGVLIICCNKQGVYCFVWWRFSLWNDSILQSPHASRSLIISSVLWVLDKICVVFTSQSHQVCLLLLSPFHSLSLQRGLSLIPIGMAASSLLICRNDRSPKSTIPLTR